jgi:hypothetical protein
MSLFSYPCGFVNMVILVCLLYKAFSAVSNFIGRAPHRGVSQLIQSLKDTVFWDVTQCSPVKIYQSFGDWFRIHFHIWTRRVACLQMSVHFCQTKWRHVKKDSLYKFPTAWTGNPLFGMVNFFIYQKLSELYIFNRWKYFVDWTSRFRFSVWVGGEGEGIMFNFAITSRLALRLSFSYPVCTGTQFLDAKPPDL